MSTFKTVLTLIFFFVLDVRRGVEGTHIAGVLASAGCGVRGEPSSFRFDIRQGRPPDLSDCILTLTPFHASRLASTSAA